ncbi:MAG: LytTR family transcriptional regulator, partial [Lachnospiraceae bacterium]|nr:LytTR family transcriptional regulator [Lachnospiraceae bacterium]
ADEIIYIETARHKNIFYVGDQTYSIYKKLDEIEEELKGMGFIRIHQSFLVNLRYVDKISSYVLYLSNGQELSVPKARYPAVKKQYMQYIGK